MYSILQIEEAILAAMQADADLTRICKTIAPFEGDIEDLVAKLDQLTAPLPAVWIFYAGSAFTEPANRSFDDEQSFILLVASKNLSGRTAAVQGTYEILELLKGLLVDSNLGLDIEPLHPVSIDVVAVTNRAAIYGFQLKTSFSMD